MEPSREALRMDLQITTRQTRQDYNMRCLFILGVQAFHYTYSVLKYQLLIRVLFYHRQ